MAVACVCSGGTGIADRHRGLVGRQLVARQREARSATAAPAPRGTTGTAGDGPRQRQPRHPGNGTAGSGNPGTARQRHRRQRQPRHRGQRQRRQRQPGHRGQRQSRHRGQQRRRQRRRARRHRWRHQRRHGGGSAGRGGTAAALQARPVAARDAAAPAVRPAAAAEPAAEATIMTVASELEGFVWEGTCSGNVTAVGPQLPVLRLGRHHLPGRRHLGPAAARSRTRRSRCTAPPAPPTRSTSRCAAWSGPAATRAAPSPRPRLPSATGTTTPGTWAARQYNDSIWNTYEIHVSPAVTGDRRTVLRERVRNRLRATPAGARRKPPTR